MTDTAAYARELSSPGPQPQIAGMSGDVSRRGGRVRELEGSPRATLNNRHHRRFANAR